MNVFDNVIQNIDQKVLKSHGQGSEVAQQQKKMKNYDKELELHNHFG